MVRFVKTKNGTFHLENEITDKSEIVETLYPISGREIKLHDPLVELIDHRVHARAAKELVHVTLENHYIVWFKLVVNNAVVETIELKPGMQPEVTFETNITDPTNVEVYLYCNQHGVWTDNLK